MFKNYKNYLFNNKTIYRSQQRFKSYYHDVCTEEVNKVALSSNDDKSIDSIETYPYGTNVCKMFESETMIVKDLFFKNI